MEPRSIYALSDVHGHLAPLNAALELIDLAGNPADELVLLGDYINLGVGSFEVLSTVKGLTEEYRGRVIALLGNHETDFLEWLTGDDEDFDWLSADTGLTTVRSFLNPDEVNLAVAGATEAITDPDAMTRINHAVKRALGTKHAALIAWLRQLPLFYETPTQIYVHAGVEEDAGEDWRLATADHVFVTKFPATFGPFHKTIIAGHIGTGELHRDSTHGIYFDGASHYYLDGNVPQTGVLNVLRYRTDTKTYEYLAASA